MTRTMEVVIIGGGVNGLACAYELGKRGMTDIVVLEKGYLGAGATGRCGAGIRQQWGMEENIILARESVKIFDNLSAELGYNTFFRQGGYLMLIYEEREYELIKKTIPLQNRLGVPTVYMTPEEITDFVPGMNVDRALGAAYCPTDGTCYPYAVLWGYGEAARRHGAEIRVMSEVTNVRLHDDGWYEVTTPDAVYRAPRIINVAGARTRDIAKMLDIDIPTEPHRHEIAVTESVKPFLEPMVISPKKGFYFSQSMRGEVIAGIGGDDGPASYSSRSSPDFLFSLAKALRETFPPLGKVRIIRQWAGLYDNSPWHFPVPIPVKTSMSRKCIPLWIRAMVTSRH